MNDFLARVTPVYVLKWTGVIFVVALEILFITIIIMSILNLT